VIFHVPKYGVFFPGSNCLHLPDRDNPRYRTQCGRQLDSYVEAPTLLPLERIPAGFLCVKCAGPLRAINREIWPDVRQMLYEYVEGYDPEYRKDPEIFRLLEEPLPIPEI